MTREITIWFGNKLILKEGDTIEKTLEELRDGTIHFEGGCELIKITEKSITGADLIRVDEDY